MSTDGDRGTVLLGRGGGEGLERRLLVGHVALEPRVRHLLGLLGGLDLRLEAEVVPGEGAHIALSAGALLQLLQALAQRLRAVGRVDCDDHGLVRRAGLLPDGALLVDLEHRRLAARRELLEELPTVLVAAEDLLAQPLAHDLLDGRVAADVVDERVAHHERGDHLQRLGGLGRRGQLLDGLLARADLALRVNGLEELVPLLRGEAGYLRLGSEESLGARGVDRVIELRRARHVALSQDFRKFAKKSKAGADQEKFSKMSGVAEKKPGIFAIL